MYTFENIYKSLKKHKKLFIYANIIAIFAVLANTPIPLLVSLLVDEVLLNKPGFITSFVDNIFQNATIHTYVFFTLFMSIFLRLIYITLKYFQTKIFTNISKELTFNIRKSILDHLEKVSLDEYEFFGSGKAASLMVTDVETVDVFISTAVSKFIISILSIIGISIVLFLINWKIALFILVLNPIVIIITAKLAKKIAVLKKKQNSTYELFQESLSETLDLFIQVRASNKEKIFIDKLTSNIDSLRKTSSEFCYKKEASHNFSMMLFLTGSDIFKITAILAVAFLDISIGQMLAIFSYIWMIIMPIESVLEMQYSFSNAKIALGRINKIFQLKQEPSFPNNQNPFLKTTTNGIILKNASFSYDGKTKILENINIEIKQGEKVAFVGASGSGKTTLAQIIVGFYPLNSGDIIFDNISIKDIGLNIVRENVFLVLQNPQMFNTTIKKNLTLGDDIDELSIWNALKVAQLHDFIFNLDDKLDTMVGKHGMKLSGGQRQRLSIARMVLQNPNIVILDESTSALDNETELKLFKELEEFLKGKTTIIIAHRLSTIKNVDTIFRFKDKNINKENVLKKF